jgi:DNA-binding response OmpR family regulator
MDPARILVVDDDPVIRELLQLHLGAEGYRVEVAEDAIAAGHAVLRSPPDLLICDVNMPHLDGLSFIEALKTDRAIAPFPVLFLTAEDDHAHRGMALGARDYLLKPIMKDRLLNAVRQALRV